METLRIDKDLINLLGRKLYSSPLQTILTRELIQNAVDACEPEDPVYVQHEILDKKFTLTVNDHGCGMDKDTLINVFLTIGGSKKKNSSVGGFGIAKVALFASDSWSLHTNDIAIDDTLELVPSTRRKGTIVVTKTDDYYTDTKTRVMLYCNRTDNPLYVNNDPVPSYDPTKILSHEGTDSGVPYTIGIADETHNIKGYVIFRIKGLVQYCYSVYGTLDDQGKNLIIDFDDLSHRPTDNTYPFSMSRESVASEVNTAVQRHMDRFAKDSLSSMKDDTRERSVNPRTGLITESVNGISYKPNTLHKRVAALYEQIILLFAERDKQDTTKFSFGVTNSPDAMASVSHEGSHKVFFINPKEWLNSIRYYRDDTLAILFNISHLAIHEFCHLYVSNHDEQFSSLEGDFSRIFAPVITENRHTLLKRIRRFDR